MRLLIRADANNFIATGHIMRCIAIAQEAIAMGHEIIFLVADHNAEGLFKKYNMSFICMDTQWDNMENEIPTISEIIRNQQADCILVDSYYVTKKYLAKLRELCKVAYIDDINMFIYPCDILIAYANYYKKFNYEERYDKNVRLLLGPKYAPLRKVFANIKEKEVAISKKKILIMSGGTDEYHFIQKALAGLDEVGICEDNIIYAICGVYNDDYIELVEKYKNKKNIILLRNVSNIHEYMCSADIAISAGGSALYELCACGTPTICYSIADNQIKNVKSFSEEGVMIYVGDIRENKVIEDMVKEIKILLCDIRKRRNISESMRDIVDGRGTERIVAALEQV